MRSDRRRLAFVVLSSLMLVGAFVPCLVDIVGDGRLTWSLYALGALVMAWLVLAPWFLLRTAQPVASWIAGALTVPAYLLLVESLGTGRGWFIRLGLPASLLGLAGWGAIVLLWRRRRVDPWYGAAGTVLILGLVGLAECILVRPYLGQDPHFAVRRAVILSIIGTSLVLAACRFAVKRLRSAARES